MTDKLTPVRCGCGGEAKVEPLPFETWSDIWDASVSQYLVRCDRCGMTTRLHDTEAEAITAWNRAIGADRCCNTCDSYEAGRYCLSWGIFCPSDHWCKDWSENE